MLSDIEIAHRTPLRPVREIAERLGIAERYLDFYGTAMAKIRLDVLSEIAARPRGKYILVTAITPTPLGEGKTVTAVGLAQGLEAIGRSAVVTLRQPSLGPVFGIKGGGAGGGYAQVMPMEQFNLHLTGDFHAVTAAHNLCAAFLDNSLYHSNPLGIDVDSITWKRVLDVNDRALRVITVGQGGKAGGIERRSGFDITAASEVMAVLALTEDLADLRRRLGRIVVAWTRDGRPVTAEDLRVAGAMTVLLRAALQPTLLQTTEHAACIAHTGTFGNIAHGNCSILADRIALSCADFVVTEAGFGADLGAEKFFNIKCRASGLRPDAAVVVTTIRGLKAHSGAFTIVPGKPLDPGLAREDLGAIERGGANLAKQIDNIRAHGVPVLVAVNRFDTDTPAEIALVSRLARDAGAQDAVVSEVHAKGGAGGRDLAHAVAAAAATGSTFRFLYDLEAPVAKKIEVIATRMYGASGVAFTSQARDQIARWEAHGFGNLPVCMAKTHLSLSHDPTLAGRPTDFTLPVREVHGSVGAGFLYALCGTILTMPGLGSTPAGAHIDIDADGKTVGLS